ncbi:MAG TPA: TldD/PmbA family protein [Candidatus Cloacimonetes bacterium]|nr:TldD/PmbA family protein [Candidatus Cloacimonadota bacterium]
MIDIFEKAGKFIKQNCTADDFVLRINRSDSHKTRFAQNAITQHIDGSNFSAGLNVAFGNKTGTASINQIDEDSLKHIIKTAEEIAKLNQPDPEFVPSERKHKLPVVNNFSQNTFAIPVEEMVDNIRKCVKNAKSKDAVLSGITSKNLWGSYLITKNGFEGFDKFSSFSHSMTLKKDTVETKVSRAMKDYKLFNLNKEIEQLNSQFDSLGKPQKTAPGKYNVILRPAAVDNLFSFFYWMMNMRDADEGVNPFTGQLGKKFFGDKFTLRSTIDDNSLISPKFGNEGLPNQNINWAKNGILKNLPTSRYYAQLKNLKPVSFSNFVIDGGNTTEQEMMSSVDSGLIINNFWYIRFIDKKKGELTGMTRDGVMYFENGKIKNSVNNFRWNEVLHDVTCRILSLGPSILKDSYTKVPTMLIRDFNFVDTSSF